LKRNKDGNLVTKSGEMVIGTEGEINVSGNLGNLVISENGDVYMKDENGNKEARGKILLSSFENEQALKAIGNSLSLENEESGEPQELNPGEGVGTIINKSLEASNVDSVKVMMDLLDATNTYEISFRILDTLHKWSVKQMK